jgi:hypothetical protein
MRPGQLEAWAATLLVEGLAAAALARAFGLAPTRAARAAVAGSLCSHPIVWWLFFELDGFRHYWTVFAIVEAFAVLSEAPFYRLAGATWRRALTLSLVVNASSVAWGMREQIWQLIVDVWHIFRPGLLYG